MIRIVLIASLLFISFNFASAYSIDSTTQSDQNQSALDPNISTTAVSDSIRNVVDNVLKSFWSGKDISITNIPKLGQSDDLPKVTNSGLVNISSQGVVDTAVDFIKLSINLLFAALSVVTQILTGILNSLNSK